MHSRNVNDVQRIPSLLAMKKSRGYRLELNKRNETHHEKLRHKFCRTPEDRLRGEFVTS